jgi:hypothetical protein
MYKKLEFFFSVFFVFLNTLFFVSCKKENLSKNNVEFIDDAFSEIDLQRAEDNGFIVLPNHLGLSIFQDDSISVCRYFLEIENEREFDKLIKNISDKIQTLYIQNNWTVQPYAHEDDYCTISGENSENFLNIVIFKIKKFKKNLLAIHMSITNKI